MFVPEGELLIIKNILRVAISTRVTRGREREACGWDVVAESLPAGLGTGAFMRARGVCGGGGGISTRVTWGDCKEGAGREIKKDR